MTNVFLNPGKVFCVRLRPTHADTETHPHTLNTHALDLQLLVACRPCFLMGGGSRALCMVIERRGVVTGSFFRYAMDQGHRVIEAGKVMTGSFFF